MSDEPFNYGLVMPFVVCQSQGGPYDDVPFVAGYECAMVDGLLLQEVEMLERTVRTANVPQLDLIAMQRGYVMATEASEDPEEWTFATFTRAGHSGS